ncbi:arsenate reductase/protein-tyrosine-phosphatase family protein [Saccharopolyspora mangrovi]|uniref:arsenate reductase/protein-tyrosine-phosphatase family protein n=1 Tax=Saccharopolyspora mangrovi TaxID=3082379 RepID=UPI00389A5F93
MAPAKTHEPGPKCFSLLFVCTGNICRSPFAEHLARALVAERLGPEDCRKITTTSSGTHAIQGAAMDPHVEADLQTMGLTGEGFTAKQLDDSQLREADLVLTAELSHRAAVVEQYPPALRTTFSLLEFAHLLTSTDLSNLRLPTDPVQRARELVRIGRSRRGTVPPAPQREIPDPFGKDPETHRVALGLITDAVRSTISRLC